MHGQDKLWDRYQRQMVLPGVGEAGQAKLAASAVAVVGCGALGTHLADLLVRAGVGHLVIIDRDFVEKTNLQRQVLFDESDVAASLPKAEAARRKLARISSAVQVTAIVDDANHTNIERFVLEAAGRTVDAVVDGLDNFETRFLLNDVAVKHEIPYIYGGAVGTSGMTYALRPHTPHGQSPWEQVGAATPCLRCIFDQAPPAGSSPTCETAGVLASTVGIVANYQFNELFKVLTGNWSAVCHDLQRFETWDNSMRQFNVARAYADNDCICCKRREFEFLQGKFASGATTLCGRDAVQLRPTGESAQLDLATLAQRLPNQASVTVNEFMLQARLAENGTPYELTVFKDGRAIIKGTQTPGIARGIYARYIGI